jgi:phage terminase large subunit GpA-like protein
MMMNSYISEVKHGRPNTGRSDTLQLLDMLKPISNRTVSDAACDYLHIDTPNYSGKFQREQTPYMETPMDCLTMREYEACIFVGIAQSGKTTALAEGWAAYAIVERPADLTIIMPTDTDAATYSKQRIDRMINASTEIKARMSNRAHDDTVHDKRFKAGNFLTIGHPSVGRFRGKNIQYYLLSDYDGYQTHANDEGSVFLRAKKRTTSYMSAGMVCVETSPAKDIKDLAWTWSLDSHVAPPCDGALGLYNSGDMRRWYWPCPECGKWFQAFSHPEIDISVLKWDRTIADPERAAYSAYVECPHCRARIDEGMKYKLNNGGEWFAEGELQGNKKQSRIASFWMFGVAAAYQKWDSLVYNYLVAKKEEEQTGSDRGMRSCLNVDWGLPLMAKSMYRGDDKNIYAERAEESLEKFIVHDDVRFLTIHIDQQINRFVVQVVGHGEHREMWLVDRYNISKSKRIGDNGTELPIRPFEYQEDWDALTGLFDRSYKYADGTEITPIAMQVDSGGKDKATENAYLFWKAMNRQGRGRSVFITKGRATGEIWKQSSEVLKMQSVPMYLLNVNLLKDEVKRALDRGEHGANYIHFPAWVGSWFYDELVAEVRNNKGEWSKIDKKKNNEAFDLFCYCRGLYYILGCDKIDWENPPKYAKKKESVHNEANSASDTLSIADIARKLNGRK